MMHPQDLTVDLFQGADHLHIEGYTFYLPGVATHAMQQAKQLGQTVSLDLGSYQVVEQFRFELIEALEHYVDIVFANELEAAALLSLGEDAACHALTQICPCAVVMHGERGAWLGTPREVVHVPACPVPEVVDTTGAGDLFAAGFLHAYFQGQELRSCGELGALLGGAVVQKMGANLTHEQVFHLTQCFQEVDSRSGILSRIPAWASSN